MTLGQRISIYRKKLGISQETLGERLGVSRQAVSKWETDAASPDMENLLALAREFLQIQHSNLIVHPLQNGFQGIGLKKSSVIHMQRKCDYGNFHFVNCFFNRDMALWNVLYIRL